MGTGPELIEQAIAEIVGDGGAQWRLTHTRGVPPVVNDPEATEFLSQVGDEEFDADSVVFSDQSWGGDTFAWYLESVPGSYARLGVHDPRRRNSSIYTPARLTLMSERSASASGRLPRRRLAGCAASSLTRSSQRGVQ